MVTPITTFLIIKTNNMLVKKISTATLFIALIASGCDKKSCPPPEKDGPVAYYPFNGNAQDESGNNNHGMVQSATLASDRNGNANRAYSFNGTNSYIDCGSASILKITGNFSMGGWLYMDGGSLNPRMLSFESPEGNYRITTTGTGNARSVNLSYGNSSLSVSVPIQEWHHVFYTYADGLAKIYLDGVKVAEANSPQTEALNYSTSLTIGRKAAPGYDAWGGKLDEIVIYDRAISSSEVMNWYQK